MAKAEIIISFFTIVYGLMLADLFKSFHGLVKKRKKIIWHWLSILTSWYLFLLIINNWWDLYVNSKNEISILNFFLSSNLLIVFYLSASIILPDKIEGDKFSLKEYYFKHTAYFWSLILVISIFNTLKIILLTEELLPRPIDVIFILCILFLIFIKKTWLHLIFILLFITFILIGMFQNYM